MTMKVIIVILLAIILYCLGSALFFMMRGHEDPRKMVQALTWRISLSFLLFLFLIASYLLGWIHPHSLIVGPVAEQSQESH